MMEHILRAAAALRSRPISSTTIASLAASASRPLVSLVILPSLLRLLGPEGLGFWVTVLSMMGIIGFLNGGLASAVITAIGRSGGSGSEARLRHVVTSAIYLSLAYAGATTAVSLPLALSIDWHGLLRLSGAITPDEVTRVVTVLILALAIGFPASVPKFVMVGLQQGYKAFMLDCIGVLLSGGLLLGAMWLHEPLHILVGVYLFAQFGVLLVGGGLYLERRKLSALRLSQVDRGIFGTLFREGSKLGLYQASFTLACQTDLLLIGLIAGAGAGAGFGVAQRVFAFPTLVPAALNFALWPAFAKADVEGRSEWLKRSFVRMFAVSVSCLSGVALCLALAYQPLIGLWLGKAIRPDPLLVAGMTCWVAVTVAVNCCDILLRAQGSIGFITKCMVAMMVVNLPLSAELIRLIGPAGAIWGTVVACFFCLLIPYLREIRKSFRGTTRQPVTIAPDFGVDRAAG